MQSNSSTILSSRGVSIDLNLTGDYELHEAAYYGRVEILELLANHGVDMNMIGSRAWEGKRPIHAVMQGHSIKTIGVLHELGADINAFDDNGRSSLVLVLMGGDFAIDGYQFGMLKELIAAGADMVACGAVQLAAAMGHFEALKLMLRAGADPDVPFSLEDESWMHYHFFGFGKSAREYLVALPPAALDVNHFLAENRVA